MLNNILKNIPENPGVYLMKKNSQVIYVGKAKNLRKRVLSYFNREHENIKTSELVKNIEDIEFIICNSEVDALILENNLIKKYSPKYNIALKDQKTYPYLKISREKFPYLKTVRNTRELNDRKGIYFGPYPNGAYNLRKALIRVFKIRDCNRDMEKTYSKPCLKYYMHFCSGPCVYKDNSSEYTERVEAIKKILKGNGEEYILELKRKMEKAGEEMKFEEAIILRNQIDELKNSVINQVTEYSKGLDEDYFTYEAVGDYLFITVLKGRDGKIIGKENMVVSLKNKLYETLDEVVVTAYYSKYTPAKNIIFQEKLEPNYEILEKWFFIKFEKKVELFFPKIKSRKKELLHMAELNLQREIEQHYKKRDVVERGLEDIYKILQLKNFPRRIECFDISNIQGKDAVASMSVAIEGVTKKDEYRKFKIQCKDTPDDFAMMREVISRRYGKLPRTQFPDMILIDGGLGQINAVGRILEELGVEGVSDLVSLAKREEEIFKYGESEPYLIPKDKEAIKIFQRVRDEAHRFGITYHRKLRSKRIISSELDKIEGIGPSRKEKLIQYFGTIEKIFGAELEELKKILPERVAERIKEHKKL
ncbi:MAG: excinuclease ABC subunit UvrC [Fusobacteriaceae bacterium]